MSCTATPRRTKSVTSSPARSGHILWRASVLSIALGLKCGTALHGDRNVEGQQIGAAGEVQRVLRVVEIDLRQGQNLAGREGRLRCDSPPGVHPEGEDERDPEVLRV